MGQVSISNGVLGAVAARTIKNAQQQAAQLGKAGATGKNLISTYTAGNLILDALKNNQYSTISASASACTNAISYLAPATAAIQEQQAILQNALALANQAATDPSVQSAASMATLNNQYAALMAQLQNVTSTTHDAAGNAILTGVIASAATGAAQYITPLTLALPANYGASIVSGLGTFATVSAGALAAINAAHIAITGQVTAGTYGNTASAALAINASLTLMKNNLIASNTNASPATLTDYISNAMGIIPTIAFNYAQVQQQIYDTKRVEQIAALLPDILVQAGVIGGGGVIANQSTASIIACLTNTAVNVPAMNNAPAGAPLAVASAGTASCIAAAALLTAAEKATLITLATTLGSVLDNATGAGQTTGAQLCLILGQISSFANVVAGPNGNPNLLTAASANSIIGAHVGAIGGNAVYWGAGANQVMPVVCQEATVVYPINTALNMLSNANYAPQRIQIGLNATDTMTLQINNTQNAALGLVATSLSIIPGANPIANAQSAVTALQSAASFLASTLATINNQTNALTARINSLNDQSDTLTDQLAAIENTDLTANASELSSVNTQISTAAALIGMQNTLKSTIANAARNILNQAANGG